MPWAARSGLEPIKKVARTIKDHLSGKGYTAIQKNLRLRQLGKS
ncbi:hypothetical protein [Candidatus Vondammii sp. HM_W22]|nr:hypothetical protein [Candidatus Vondammii sp. HM_W22]